MAKNTLIEKTTHDLGLAIVASLRTSGIPLKMQEYYLQHKEMISKALYRGMLLNMPEDILSTADIWGSSRPGFGPLLVPLTIVTVPSIKGKKTKDCFRDKSRFNHREKNLDIWLPETQPRQVKSNFSVRQLVQETTFKQTVEDFLGITGEVKNLAQALKSRRAVTTLAVIESLIERQEYGENVGLRTDDRTNFFFVEENEKKEDSGISIVGVGRYCGKWRINISRFSYRGVWHDGNRFFFRSGPLAT